jgi:hypothetical protein
MTLTKVIARQMQMPDRAEEEGESVLEAEEGYSTKAPWIRKF